METATNCMNADILDGIRIQDNTVIRKIYSDNFPIIRNLVLLKSGSIADAEDIFQEALVIIYNKVAKDELILSCSFKTYLYAVCDRLWKQQLNKKGREIPMPDYYEVEDKDDIDLAIVEEKMYMLYQVHFLAMSDECQKVLRLYISKVPMDMIAKLMGYKTEEYAKVKKFMCKKKLKEVVLSDPRSKLLLEDYKR